MSLYDCAKAERNALRALPLTLTLKIDMKMSASTRPNILQLFPGKRQDILSVKLGLLSGRRQLLAQRNNEIAPVHCQRMRTRLFIFICFLSLSVPSILRVMPVIYVSMAGQPTVPRRESSGIFVRYIEKSTGAERME